MSNTFYIGYIVWPQNFTKQKQNLIPTSLTYCCVNYMPKDAWQHYYEFLAVYHAHPYP